MSHLRNWLLNAVYLAAIVVCLPWIVYAAVRKGKYREGFGEKLDTALKSDAEQRALRPVSVPVVRSPHHTEQGTKCYNCNMYGHVSPNCPAPRRPRRN